MEQIGTVTINGTVFYVLFIKANSRIHQALYSFASDGSIKFDQLTPLEEVREIQIPANSTFIQLSLSAFRLESNYQVISKYFADARPGLVDLNSVTNVSKTVSGIYTFYRL